LFSSSDADTSRWPRILARAAQLFDDPIYGVIGGLHYPLPRGRWLQFGLDLQRFLVYGPFGAPRRSDVDSDIALLASHHPEWVFLSAHDSSDEMIEEFRRVFGSRYRDLRVGDWQILGESQRGVYERGERKKTPSAA
jgi:7,8-dihydropterin-6-yl-methyl-4-(beta-D-ribofuranosyl)aminobenzene 5'-phosphate synthase